jgi:hypothetical protein
MENVTKTVSIETIAQILTVATTLATSTETATAHTEAIATAHLIESTHAVATVCHAVACVEHVAATEEVKEACIVSIAIDETKIVGEELSAIWSEVRNNEVNLNELFSTELSFVNGRLTVAIAPRVATV